MVQILPENPSFGVSLARGLGAGIGAGISQGAQFAAQMGMEKFKNAQRQKQIQAVEGLSGTKAAIPQEQLDQQFLEALPQIEKALGRELTPQDLDQLYSHAQKMSGMMEQSNETEQDPFLKAKKYAAIGEHDLSRIETEKAKLQQKENTKAKEEK